MKVFKLASELLVIAFLFMACTNPPTSTEITLFNVDRTTVTGVEEVTLTWEIKHAKDGSCSVFRDYKGQGGITQKEISTQCSGSVTHTPAAEVKYIVGGLKNDNTGDFLSKDKTVTFSITANTPSVTLPIDTGSYQRTTEITVNTCSSLTAKVGDTSTETIVMTQESLNSSPNFFVTKDRDLYISTRVESDKKSSSYMTVKSRTEYESVSYIEDLSENCVLEFKQNNNKNSALLTSKTYTLTPNKVIPKRDRNGYGHYSYSFEVPEVGIVKDINVYIEIQSVISGEAYISFGKSSSIIAYSTMPDCSGNLKVWFDDSAPLTYKQIPCSEMANGLRYQSHEKKLSDLNGSSMQGGWRFAVGNADEDNLITLKSWKVEFTYQ